MTTDLSPFLGNTGIVRGSPEPAGFYGPYRGIVTNTTDPAGQNRIKAVVPQLFGNASTECDWALPCQLPGLQSTPSPGQGVWIMFEGGDINYPIYMGMWQAEPSVAPYDTIGAASAAQAASDPLGAAAAAVATSEAYTNSQLGAYYPALLTAAGTLASDYTTTGSFVTFLTTASLGIGTWKITLNGIAEAPTGGIAPADIVIAVGTASATFQGQLSTEARVDGTTNTWTVPFSLNNYAIVTSPGTLVFQAFGPGGTKPLIKALTPSSGASGATGYTALRVK